MNSAPLLRAINCAKTFDSFTLQNISIEIFPGEVHVIVGENGTGKSTMMKMLGGWFQPDSGHIEYLGQPRHFESIHDARKAGIVYIHQDIMSFDNLSVAENIFFNQIPESLGSKNIFRWNKIRASAAEIFKDLQIPIDPLAMMGSLGFAQRQLVAAVRAYISTAKVIIFDEPSSAMNEPEREILFKIVARLVERGSGIFYISHRMDEIHRVGDRVSVLNQGRIQDTRPVPELNRSELVQMMTGDVHKDRYPKISKKLGPVIMSVQGLKLMPILKSINFELHSGEILGITGLMGSGRSLLANCLFGIAQIDEGTIEIEGSPVSLEHPGDAMNSGISLIPEDRVDNGIFPKHNLVRNLTSATLSRFQKNFTLDERFMNELSHQYVQELRIAPGSSTDTIETYSGGNQQKVLVGRWLMKRSKIYIMDEPTRGVDPASKVDIYNTMNEMVSKKASIILISSEIEEILGMSDRILVLAGGRICDTMLRKDASKARILEKATLD